MRSRNKALFTVAGALALASCGTGDRPRVGNRRAVSDLPVKVGAPYQVSGRTYVPRDEQRYDATGYASWYGRQHRGRATANGERFDPDGISAAHTTLPLPSYVAVTALDTGRTILVRVNDRGPFVAGRIIDLSQGAARLLGTERMGVARVRVRRVNPSEADRAALRAGHPAGGRGGAAYAGAPTPLPAERRAAKEGIPAPPLPTAAPITATAGLADIGAGVGAGAVGASARQSADAPPAWSTSASSSIPSPPASSVSARSPGTFYVQVAALADPDRADALASMLRPIGPASADVLGSAWRVRLGPYANEADALSALARARQAGYQDARVVRDSAP